MSSKRTYRRVSVKVLEALRTIAWILRQEADLDPDHPACETAKMSLGEQTTKHALLTAFADYLDKKLDEIMRDG